MSVSEIDAGKGGGAVIGSAGVTGVAAGGSSITNLLIAISVMSVIAIGFYLFVRHQANKENNL